MRIAIRADSSPTIGTGHVMRCLTLAEGLIENGDSVALFTSEISVQWLKKLIQNLDIELFQVDESEISIGMFENFNPDWIVVDSYLINSDEISKINTEYKTLAIVSMDTRGIRADLYLDQNFKSEELDWGINHQTNVLAGAKYSLIRESVLNARREEPWNFIGKRPNVLCIMGGSDPTGTIIPVCEAILGFRNEITATLVCSPQWNEKVANLVGDNHQISLVEPTPSIGKLFSEADIVVSAAGSSAWEICTLGIPALLIAVADNQQQSLEQINNSRLALTLDRLKLNDAELIQSIKNSIAVLIHEQKIREELSKNSLAIFDGEGKHRVAGALENINKPPFGLSL